MFTIKGLQFKDDAHSTSLSAKNVTEDTTIDYFIQHKKEYDYEKIRTVVLNYVFESYDEGNYDIVIWKTICKVAKNLKCTCVCRYGGTTYIANENSSIFYVTPYHEALQKKYLHVFGPDIPNNSDYPTNPILYNFHSINSYNSTIRNYEEELKKNRVEKIELIHDIFVKGIEDIIPDEEFSKYTSEDVRLTVHFLYPFIIGLCKESKKKYFYYGDNIPDAYLNLGKEKSIYGAMRSHYLVDFIKYCVNFSSETKKQKVLEECGDIMKKHVYKVYGKNKEVGYSNIMDMVDYVRNWTPSYL